LNHLFFPIPEFGIQQSVFNSSFHLGQLLFSRAHFPCPAPPHGRHSAGADGAIRLTDWRTGACARGQQSAPLECAYQARRVARSSISHSNLPLAVWCKTILACTAHRISQSAHQRQPFVTNLNFLFFQNLLSLFSFFCSLFWTSLVRTRSRWTRRGRATAHSLCSFRTMGAYCTRVVCRRMRRWPTRVSSVALSRRKSRRCVHFARGSGRLVVCCLSLNCRFNSVFPVLTHHTYHSTLVVLCFALIFFFTRPRLA
jgi:hypothetical protein